MNLRYPNITGGTPAEQILQLKGFLYNLVEELNLQEGSSNAVRLAGTPLSSKGGKSTAVQESSSVGQFNQIKNLIIKSADIVNAYYEEINKRLEGVYVAESEFGTYTEQTAQTIRENSEEINRNFDKLQEITGQINSVIATNAWVKQGLLFTVDSGSQVDLEQELGQSLSDGTPVYGVEVGQTVDRDGVEVFRKFARFTAYGMTLYDNNGNLSAYITDSRLHIPNAVVKVSLTRGGFQETINADGGSVERWVGV